MIRLQLVSADSDSDSWALGSYALTAWPIALMHATPIHLIFYAKQTKKGRGILIGDGFLFVNAYSRCHHKRKDKALIALGK